MAFWDLSQCTQPIHYANQGDYVAHFSALLSEALRAQMGHDTNIAAEFSGGLDSSAVVAACHNGIQPALFMHIANPGSHIIDDMAYAQTAITVGASSVIRGRLWALGGPLTLDSNSINPN